jgi:ferredoxin-thioredoxin reductase catalytic chain
MCAGINEEGGLSGGTADLRECDHDRTSESWKFTAVARSIEHPYGMDAQLSSMRLGVAASLWMIGLGALSLSVWLWRWQSGARVTAMQQHRLPLDVAQGGVSLCAPFIACEGNAMLTPRFDTSAQVEVPAVMTTSPEPIGEGINMVSDEELEALCKALSEEVHEEPVELDPAKVEKAMKGMVAFSNTYAKRSGTKFCSQREIPAAVIRGLAENKVRLGAPLCPCRSYDDEKAEVKNGAMNCPCEPMRTNNDCHCMLFLKEDDEFAAGDTQKLTLDEVKELAAVS